MYNNNYDIFSQFNYFTNIFVEEKIEELEGFDASIGADSFAQEVFESLSFHIDWEGK